MIVLSLIVFGKQSLGLVNFCCFFFVGDCICRKGIYGRNCNLTIPGRFYPSFSHYILEAEFGLGVYEYASNITGFNSLFTGSGLVNLSNMGYVTLHFVPKFTARYAF